MHPREGVRELRAASCAGEQSVEPVRAAAAERCRPSASTAQCSARPWEQPGEEQEAPFSDHPVHRGSRLVPMAVLERIPCELVASPCDQRLVVGGPRAVGSARPAGMPCGARGSLVTKGCAKVTPSGPPPRGPRRIRVLLVASLTALPHHGVAVLLGFEDAKLLGWIYLALRHKLGTWLHRYAIDWRIQGWTHLALFTLCVRLF